MIFLIRSDGKILLQRRSPSNATFLGCWDSSSSFHVTFGESYEQAARRELKEEAGVSTSLTYLGKFAYHVPPENEIVAVFSCRSDDAIRIDHAESSEASFHTRDDVNVIAECETAGAMAYKGMEDTSRPNYRSRVNRGRLLILDGEERFYGLRKMS